MHLKLNFITYCTLTLFVAAFVVFQLPGHSVVSSELKKAGHTLSFAALTFAVPFSKKTLRLPNRTLLLIVTLMMLIGILIELGQWATGRGFSALDIAKDLIGVLAGLCFYFAFSLPCKIKHQLAAFIAGSIILTGSLATTIALSLSRELSPRPVLVDFEQWGVAHRIQQFPVSWSI